MRKSRLKLCTVNSSLLVLAIFLLPSCATGPLSRASQPIFYPPLPNPPRIQYLASFSSADDLRARRTSFLQFGFGKNGHKREVIRPYGIAFFQGKLYVVDVRGPGYAIFDLETKQYKFISGSGSGKMRKPINITIDQDGTKYVTDVGRNQILVFDREERFMHAFGVLGQFKPCDAVIARNRLYVSDTKHHVVHVLDKNNGEVLFDIGAKGDAEGEFRFPTNLTVGPDGQQLYVTDTINARIQTFTLDGRFIRSFGRLGDAPGEFVRPKGVALDKDGRMYVVDAAFENVQFFDKEGKLLLFFGEPGTSPENINLPTVVVIDYESAPLFQKYADPGFKLEYVLLVASQYGKSKVSAFGFGAMEGMDYTTASSSNNNNLFVQSKSTQSLVPIASDAGTP